jgi:N-acyl amino acid synthase of PEP-CTERM/exosortase system
MLQFLDDRNHGKRTASIGSRPIDLFARHLTVVQANSAVLLDNVFRLRFQVYCLERGFENAAEYPDGRERDHDDSRSTHFLVLYRAAVSSGGPAAGTVRFILPRPGLDLPVFRLIKAEERRSVELPFESTVEVSRFAIAKAYRKQFEKDLREDLKRPGLANGRLRSRVPVLTFGLLRAVVMMSVTGGISHIVALMEPALLRLLSHLGIEFNSMGGLVEHHGLRRPVWAAMAHVVECVKHHYPELWEFATDAGRQLPTEPGIACRKSGIADGRHPWTAARSERRRLPTCMFATEKCCDGRFA